MRKEYLKIRDFCEVYDGLHATPTKTDEGPFYLSISSLSRGTLDLSKSAHLSEQEFQKWTKRVTPRKGDLLFSYETRLGEAALMPDGIRACLGRRMGILRPDTKKVLPEYLLYSYIAPEFQGVISSNTITGATVDRLSLTDFPDFEMRIPKIDQQRHIVAILSALDSKIELNHRINGELEGMAKLLYDYWFVQYDFPLSASQAAALGKPRLAGKPYRSSGGPMVFNPDLKREIPKGWSSVTFDVLAENYDSKRIPLSKEERTKRQGQFPYYGATSVMDYVDDYIFDGQFILLAEDGSIMDKDGFPIMQFIDGKSWVNNHAHVIRPRNMDNMEFLFHSLKRLAVVNIVTGSIQKKITQDNLNKVNLLEPDSNILGKFAQFANPIRQQLLSIQQQNQELTTLRDWLLPMLMNGQVRVG